MYLYHYSNPFQKEYISKINVTNGEFFFQKKLNEPDAYIISNPDQDEFFLFIWDGNVTLKIDSIHSSNSKIINSPLTNEMKIFDMCVVEKYVKPIWKLDTLIKSLGKRLGQDSLKIVQDKRNQLFSKGPEEVRIFTRKYVMKHPDSFVGLYELVYRGVVLDNQDKEMIEKMSGKLKMHSRFKELVGRSKE